MFSRQKTYDARCFDLAEYFVGDGPKGSEANRKCCDLASRIQQCIEDYESEQPGGTMTAPRDQASGTGA